MCAARARERIRLFLFHFNIIKLEFGRTQPNGVRWGVNRPENGTGKAMRVDDTYPVVSFLGFLRFFSYQLAR